MSTAFDPIKQTGNGIRTDVVVRPAQKAYRKDTLESMQASGGESDEEKKDYVAFILNTEFDNGASTRLNADQPKERGIDKEKDNFKDVFVDKLGLDWINENKFENLTVTDWDRSANRADEHACPSNLKCLRCNILSRDYSSCKYFVLVVSTHGREEQEQKLLMSDGKILLLSKITDVLRDKKLANVTKILILQACRTNLSVLDQCVNDLKNRIGTDQWRRLGAKLKIRRAELNMLQRDYSDNVPKCIEIMLTPWRDSMRKSYTVEGVRHLSKALREARLVNLALEMKVRLSRRWDRGARIPGLLDQLVYYLRTRIERNKWRLLGAKLRVKQTDLEELQQEYPDNVPACIDAILTSWRVSIYKSYSVKGIRHLSKALKKVGLVELGRETKDRLPKLEDKGVQGLLDQCIDDLKTRIGLEKLHPLGAKLGTRRADLEKLRQDYPDNVPACIDGILTPWSASLLKIYILNGVRHLSKALKRVGLAQLARETKGILPKRRGRGAGVPVDSAEKNTTGTTRSDQETNMDPIAMHTDPELPMLRLQDPPPTFLIVHSTTKGRISYCSNTNGSWMLNCMSKAIPKPNRDSKQTFKLNFLTFVTNCNFLISEKESFIFKPDENVRDENKRFKCTMCISHRLSEVPTFDL